MRLQLVSDVYKSYVKSDDDNVLRQCCVAHDHYPYYLWVLIWSRNLTALLIMFSSVILIGDCFLCRR
jgi:hypothetical protein